MPDARAVVGRRHQAGVHELGQLAPDRRAGQPQVGGEVRLGRRLTGEPTGEAQPGRIGEGPERGQHVVVHGARIVRCARASRRPSPRCPPAPGERHGEGRRARPRPSGPRRCRSSATTRPPGVAAPSRRPSCPPSASGSLARDIGPVAIHASYLINLAGPEPDFRERSISLLAHELRAAPAFEARFVNVHIGSHRDTSVAAGTTRLADAVAQILAEVDDTPEAARLVLENSSGSGFGLGTSVAELDRHRRRDRRARDRRRPDRLLPRYRPCLGRGRGPLEPGRHRRLPGRLRRADRARPPGHGPSQRFEVRAWLPCRPPRAPRGRPDRGRGPRARS